MVPDFLWVALGNQGDIYLTAYADAEERWEANPTAANWRRLILAREKAAAWRTCLQKHPIPNYCLCETQAEKEKYIAALNRAHREFGRINFTR